MRWKVGKEEQKLKKGEWRAGVGKVGKNEQKLKK